MLILLFETWVASQIIGVYEFEGDEVEIIEFDREEMTIFLVAWFDFAGDDAVETNQGLCLLYMHAGTNPFEVINQSIK